MDYQKLSQDLGLHKDSMNFIRTKSSKFIEHFQKMKNSDAGSVMNSSRMALNFDNADKLPLKLNMDH